MKKRTLIIVCGLPGSGKTTLVRKLSRHLNIAYFARDILKELLYEVSSGSTLEDSYRIGTLATRVLFPLVEEQLQNGGADIIVEGVFNYAEDHVLFARWASDYNVDVKTVVCTIDEEIRKKRFVERAHEDRHEAHHDVSRLKEGGFENITKHFDYKTIVSGEKSLFVVTDKGVDQTMKEILEWFAMNG